MRFAHRPLNCLAVAVAVWLAAWSISPILVDASYMQATLPLLAASVIVSLSAALLRAPRLLVIALQAIAMGVILVWRGLALVPPGGDTGRIDRLLQLARTGVDVVRNGTLPLPNDPALLWLILAVVAVVTVLVELLVNALEQPAWSIVPLVVVYGIGALALPREMSAWHFMLLAAGYVLVLLVATGFGSEKRSGRRDHVLAFEVSRVIVGALAAVVAVAIALAVTPALPLGDKQPWLESGRNTDIRLSDPTVQLNENLTRPAAQDVLFYRTDTGAPVYLRTVALTRLTVEGAQLVPMKLSTSKFDVDRDAPGQRVETHVEMQLPSEYLPVPFAVTGFDAAGQWAHDPATLSIVATGDDRLMQTADLRYTATSVLPAPTRAELDAAGAGVDPAGPETLTVPAGLDPGVATLTDAVTAGAATPGAKAQSIQRFLRSGEFQYSLEAPQSTSLDAISSFLLKSHSGYCIHFAAAMVTMARLEGIPARMAVGFTPGEARGDGYVVTTHNMHTWPELYFDSLGWVPFEPTKSIASPPGYTDPDQAAPSSPSPSPSPSPTSSLTAAPTQPPEPTVSASPPENEPGDSSGYGWLLLLGVLVLVALPMGIRTLQRYWRLRRGQEPAAAAEGAWREVHALFTDFGHDWDPRTPGLAMQTLARHIPAQEAATLARIAATVERVRYARAGADTSELAEQVRALHRELMRNQPGERQARALLLPASLLSRPVLRH